MQNTLLEEINFERICLLYRSAPIAVHGLIVGFFSLYLAVKDLLATQYLIIWSCFFATILIWRLILIFMFKRQMSLNNINKNNIHKWETYWIGMTIATALVLASLLFFPFAKDSLIALLFITTVFMGLSSGCAISSNSSKAVVITFLTFTTLPLVFKALYDAQAYYYLIAFIYSFFYLVLIRLTLNSNQVVVENITLKQQSERESLTDQLTGLWNRRRLKLYIEKLIPHALRNQEPFSIILLDIDLFKKFNDTHGHLKGDQELVKMANCLQREVREEDLVVRFGGEEFLIVLSNSDISMAQSAVERIIQTVHSEMESTISAGITLFSPELNFEQIVKQADTALYSAKNKGRDQFVIFSSN